MEDRLRKFASLIDSGSFTKAAAQLHMSQPALTLTIKKLERELKAELLTRSGRSFQLTAAGKVAYSEGKDLLVRRANLRQQLASVAQEKVPLALGMIDSVADALFATPDALAELEQVAEVSLSVNNSSFLRRAVEQNQLDLAIIAEPLQLFPQTISQIPLGSEPLVFVTHPALAAAVRGSLLQGKLPQFLSYNQSSTTYQLINKTVQQAAVELETIFYSTSPEVILRLVLGQKGVAALPQLLVREHIKNGDLAPVFMNESCQVTRNIVAIKPQGRTLPDATGDILKEIATTLRGLSAEAARY